MGVIRFLSTTAIVLLSGFWPVSTVHASDQLAQKANHQTIHTTVQALQSKHVRKRHQTTKAEDLHGWIEEGSMVVETNEPVYLNGAADSEEGELTYTWTLGDGTTTEGENIEVTYPNKGAYRVSLVVSDGELTSEPYEIFIFANDPTEWEENEEPVGNIDEPAWGQYFSVDEAVTFSASGQDSDGDDLHFFWDFADGFVYEGPTVTRTFDEPSFNEETQTLEEAGAQVFVRDNRGLTRDESYYVPFTIYEGTPPPNGEIKSPPLPESTRGEVDYGEDMVFIRDGEAVTFEGGLAGTTNTDGISGQWYLFSLTEENDEYTLTQIGSMEGLTWVVDHEMLSEDMEHVISFSAIDTNTGLIDPIPAIRHIQARTGNEPPEQVVIEEPGWDEGYPVGEGVELGASVYDDDGDEIHYMWKISLIDSDTQICEEGERAYVVFDTPGLWKVELTATDPDGASGIALENRYIWIYEDEPNYATLPNIEEAKPARDQLVVHKGDSLNFEATATTEPDRTIVRWLWDVPGSTQNSTTNKLSNVTFKQPGLWIVKATAIDSAGYWGDPTSWAVYVFEENLPPTVNIIEPTLNDHEDEFFQRATHIWQGNSLSFTGEGQDRENSQDSLMPYWFLAELDFEEDEEEIETEFLEERSGNWNETFEFPESGTYVVIFSGMDAEGDWTVFEDYRIVIVMDPEETPDSYILEPATDIVVEPGEELYFFGFGEHSAFPAIQLEWDFAGADVPAGPLDTDVYPVVFQTESPEDQPYQVTLTAKTVATINGEFIEVRDPTPAVINVTVKRFEDNNFEPNDTIGQAASLKSGTYSNLSLTGGTDDADFFTFTVSENANDLKLGLGAVEGQGNLKMTFYRQVDGTYEEWDAGNVGEADGQGVVTLENLLAGEYAVEVSLSESATKRRRNFTYSLSIATLEPALFLPFMVEDGNFSSKVGIINATNETADIAIQGLDAKGTPISCKAMTLPAHGRTYVSGISLFGNVNGKAIARDISWLKVSSTHRLLGYTNAQSLDNKQLSSVGAVRTLSAATLIPHVAQATHTWYTRAVMVNVDQSADAIQFESPTTTNNVASALKDGEQVDFRFVEKFDAANLPGWGRFKNPANAATLAGFEMFGRVDGFQQVAGLEMVDLRDKNPNFVQVNGNLYFTHIASQDIFWTGMSLINTDNQEATYNIVAYNDAGAVVARLDAQTMPIGGKLVTTSAALFPDRNDIAWVAVETGFEMAGFELFGDYSGKILSGFKATRFLTDELVFPHLQVVDGQWYTGIALLNVASQPVALEITLYADDGSVVLQKQENLEAGRKLVRLAQLIFTEGLPATGTYLVVRTVNGERVLSGFEIFGTLDAVDPWGELLGGLPALKD